MAHGGGPADDGARRRGVHALLHPRTVAIVGAGDRPGSWPQRIRGNLERFGYAGTVYPVNPRREQVWGAACYPDLAALPETPDHLVVLIPAAAALETVRLGARLGVRSATIFSSGFGDHAGGPPLSALTAVADRSAMALSGPNCLGNISVPASMVTTTDSRLGEIMDGPVAVVGQSGGVVTALHRVLVGRGIGARYMVSSGNETCLTTADYLRYFATDDGVRVVAAFVESVRDLDAFLGACDALAARGKRLVALKVGRSEAGRTAARSHTGALAGSFDAFEAVTAAHGVISVGTIDQAVEACEFLSRVPAPTGGKVAVITVSGGVRELVLDGAAAAGVPLAAFSDATRRALTELVGPEMDVGNPLDSGFAGLSDAGVLVRCAETAAADPDVGLVLLQEELLGRPEPGKEATLARYDAAFPGGTVGGTVPVALFSMASLAVTGHGRALRRRLPHLAFLQSTDKALATVGALLANGAAGPAAPAPATGRAARRDGALALLRDLPAHLTEVEAKHLIRHYGFTTPEETHADTPARARAWAAGHRAPYVVKRVSRESTHKSDTGGVLLGLPDPDAVEAACRGLAEDGEPTEGFLVAEQAPPGVELVLGFVRDPEVGPVVMVGAGGISVELFGDVAFAPAPCTRDQALAALRRTRAAALLGPWRGRPGCDLDAVADAVCAMADLAADLGDIVESAEVNPLLVRAGAPGALALDAVVLRPAPPHQPAPAP
ncbi:acetate--CoA ligase family protein [Streptomyces sp. NPDC050560]|uniref:acetate--CoA ligase family protein n=1 Tax=Streptomyces sp. NPDC050560 TaxID=3365630 RepID=UPI0037B3ECBB